MQHFSCTGASSKVQRSGFTAMTQNSHRGAVNTFLQKKQFSKSCTLTDFFSNMVLNSKKCTKQAHFEFLLFIQILFVAYLFCRVHGFDQYRDKRQSRVISWCCALTCFWIYLFYLNCLSWFLLTWTVWPQFALLLFTLTDVSHGDRCVFVSAHYACVFLCVRHTRWQGQRNLYNSICMKDLYVFLTILKLIVSFP